MPEQPQVPVPADYSDEQAEAFRAGFRTCAQLFGNAASTYIAATQTDDPDEDADDDEACRECGGDLLSSMGASDSEYSPGGYVCPDCEL